MIGSSTVGRQISRPDPAAQPGTTTESVDQPGRWLGGAAGALASLMAAGVSHAIDPDPSGTTFLDFTGVALLGIPIGFALGRAFWPYARSGGWRHALAIGIALAFAAPPLGAVEILGIPAVAPWADGSTSGLALLIALPIAVPISYLAVVVTLPVGLLWAVLVKLIPDGAAARLRVPRAFARLGVRHALIALVTWAVVVQLATLRLT